jgi:Zn/Cd-binding protein ZinT
MNYQEKQLEALGIKTFDNVDDIVVTNDNTQGEIPAQDGDVSDVVDSQEETTDVTPTSDEPKAQDAPTEPVTTTEPVQGQQEEEITEKDIVEFISSQFEMEFSTLDEIKEKLAGSLKEEDSFANDEIRQINEFVKQTGRSISDFYFVQGLNVTEMDDLSAVKTKYKMLYPELSDDEVDSLLDDTFKISEDDYSEKDVKVGKARLKTEASIARNELNKMRSELVKPVENKEQPTKAEELTNYASEVKTAITDLEEIEFDGLDWRFKFGEEEKKALSSSVGDKGLESLFDSFSDGEGNIDFAQFAAAKYLLDNADSLFKLAIEHGKSIGREEVVSATKNPSVEKPTKSDSSTMSPRENIAQQILSQMSSRTLNIKKL